MQTANKRAKFVETLRSAGNRKLFLALSFSETQRSVTLEPLEAVKAADKDWERDRQGHDFLDRERLMDCWFQLADLWTENICAQEYAAFLRDVLSCLTYKDADGRVDKHYFAFSHVADSFMPLS